MQHHENLKKKADKILDECCREYKTYLFKYAFLRTGNDKDAAEDCVQEALMIFYKRLLKGEEFEHPKAFLYRTVDNLIKEFLREKKKQTDKQIPLDSNEAESIGSFDKHFENIDERVENEIIANVISTLSENDKQIYISRYVENLSVKEISEKLSISVSAVTTRLLRLRERVSTKVRQELKERGIFDE